MPDRRVLLLDAELRHSLAVVRSLGRHGIRVTAASSDRHFPTRYSRYVSGHVLLRSDSDLEGVLAAIERERIQVVMAAGLAGNSLLAHHSDRLDPLVSAPFNDIAQFERLANKRATLELAASLGVPHPVTEQVRSPDEAPAIARRVGFPLVFKSPLDQGTVRYPQDMTELRDLVAQFQDRHADFQCRGIYPIVQEYIEGDGHGFFALSDHGRIRAYYMHRRLHEVPPTGGPSAMAASYRDPELLHLGERLLSATGWHGVAMVEFKKARRDGRYYLMEVNPKFWGSLDLSIHAGVDFPWLLYEMLTGRLRDSQPGSYRDDAVFQWLTMDLAYAAATRNFRGYLRRLGDRNIGHDFEATDPVPTAALFAKGLRRAGTGAASFRIQERRNRLALRAFYLAKPLLPRPAQVAARRVRAQRIWRRLGQQASAHLPAEPLNYPWPGGTRACVLITHDVESDAGQRNAGRLLEIEESCGITSCWNFIVCRYAVDMGLISALRATGHEVGVHGVYHDGKLFDSEAVFEHRLGIMREAAAAWGAVGFRSPSLIYDIDLLKRLPFTWDSSMPAYDPFQPKPGDCHRYVPFRLNDWCVELPVTLWQDFTLFEELRMNNIAVWRGQIDALYAAGGLINVIVHPDYMLSPARLDLYRALLDHIASKPNIWVANPRDVAARELSGRGLDTPTPLAV